MNRRKKRVSQSVTRPTRTAVQGTAGYLVAEFIDTFVELDKSQLTILALILTALFSYVQTTVENHVGKGFLRDVPPTTDPVPGA